MIVAPVVRRPNASYAPLGQIRSSSLFTLRGVGSSRRSLQLAGVEDIKRRVRPTRMCFFGCGQATAKNRHFVVRHDRKAETAVIREFYGTIADFVVEHRGVPS
jgi:hypothetical protein